MADVELVVRWSKRFESALASRHGATGRGLHEKIDSVERDLPRGLVRDLRLVATVRNKIVHEDGYDRIERKREFLDACTRAERALGEKGAPRMAIVAVAVAVAAAVIIWRAVS